MIKLKNVPEGARPKPETPWTYYEPPVYTPAWGERAQPMDDNQAALAARLHVQIAAAGYDRDEYMITFEEVEDQAAFGTFLRATAQPAPTLTVGHVRYYRSIFEGASPTEPPPPARPVFTQSLAILRSPHD